MGFVLGTGLGTGLGCFGALAALDLGAALGVGGKNALDAAFDMGRGRKQKRQSGDPQGGLGACGREEPLRLLFKGDYRRPAIEIQIIRKDLNSLRGGIRWVDHPSMIADSLTKIKGSDHALFRLALSIADKLQARSQARASGKTSSEHSEIQRCGIKEKPDSCETAQGMSVVDPTRTVALALSSGACKLSHSRMDATTSAGPVEKGPGELDLSFQLQKTNP